MWQELEQYAQETGFGTLNITLKMHEHNIVRADVTGVTKSFKYHKQDNVDQAADILQALKNAHQMGYTGSLFASCDYKDGIIKSIEIDDVAIIK